MGLVEHRYKTLARKADRTNRTRRLPIGRVLNLRALGKTENEIAETFGMTVIELHAAIKRAKADERHYQSGPMDDQSSGPHTPGTASRQ